MKIKKIIDTIKPYDPNHLTHLIRFSNEIEKLGLVGCGISLEMILAYKGISAYNLEKSLYIVENAGTIRGYVHVLPEPFIKRCVVSYLVHPADQTDRLSRHLLDRALQKTKELKLARAHIFTSNENPLEKAFLGMMGFKHIRRFYEMNLDLQKARLPNADNVPFLCRAFNKGEEAALTRLQNRSFKNAWGFNPNTVAEIVYRTELPDCLPEGIFITWDADRPIAYCWTKINLKRGNHKNKRSGSIQMFGVDPNYRGLGLAKQVFTAGLNYLIKQGIDIAQITVDSENEAALTIYKSAGFVIEDTTLWFEKKDHPV